MDKVDFKAVSGKDFGRIIVAVIDGEAWISGTDAAKATGHVWTDFAVEKFVKDSDKRTADIPDNQIVVNRNGLHSLVAESRKPYAEKAEKAIIKAVFLQENESETECVEENKETINSNGITIFNNAEFGEVRTLETEDGKVLFCGADVAKALGYINAPDAISKHCKKDGIVKCDSVDLLGRKNTLSFITEGNVYRLITHSKLPNAERFEAWVFDEVLPSIRKTGSYTAKSIQEEVHKTENVQDEKDNDMIKFSVNTLVEIAKADCLSTREKRIVLTKATEMLLGEKIISVDNTEEDSNIVSTDIAEYDAEEKLYSATEIGNMFGLSRQKIVYVAKQNNIHNNEEYGRFQLFYNVNIFCYNEKAVACFREILGENHLVIDVIA